jgi:hypothetical protein
MIQLTDYVTAAPRFGRPNFFMAVGGGKSN